MYNRNMLMAALLLTAMVFTRCGVSNSRGSKGKPGVWQATPVAIDGMNNDWPTPYSYYDDKAMLGYMVSNDSENLYITVETGDAATQLKIMKEGLTVWLDKTGKEQCITAINYPIPESAGKKDAKEHYEDIHPAGTQYGPADIQKRMLDIRTRVKEGIANATEYSLQGFKECNMQFPLLATNACGIQVHMSMDQDNELIWEAKIPFKAFYFRPTVGRIDRSREIGICLETVAAKRPQGVAGQNNGGRRSGGFRPGFSVGTGMGMGMGVGMQRGGYRGGNNTAGDPNANLMEPLYKSTKTWVHAGIAVR